MNDCLDERIDPGPLNRIQLVWVRRLGLGQEI